MLMTCRPLGGFRTNIHRRGVCAPAMSRRVRAKVAEKQVLVPIAEGTEEMEVCICEVSINHENSPKLLGGSCPRPNYPVRQFPMCP